MLACRRATSKSLILLCWFYRRSLVKRRGELELGCGSPDAEDSFVIVLAPGGRRQRFLDEESNFEPAGPDDVDRNVDPTPHALLGRIGIAEFPMLQLVPVHLKANGRAWETLVAHRSTENLQLKVRRWLLGQIEEECRRLSLALHTPIFRLLRAFVHFFVATF